MSGARSNWHLAKSRATENNPVITDTLGVGFSYEEIFEMCQRVTKMDSLQTRSTMSPLSADRIVNVESPRIGDNFLDTEAGKRRRISFRKHVSEQSASVERTFWPDNNRIIIGGNMY